MPTPVEKRRAVFQSVVKCYHNDLACEGKAEARHSKEFIKRAMRAGVCEAVTDTDPRLTSTSFGAAAVMVARKVMENGKAAKAFIDVEIAGMRDPSLCVTFDRNIDRSVAYTLLSSLGEAALLCKPDDKIAPGVVSDVHMYLVEPGQAVVNEALGDALADVISESPSPVLGLHLKGAHLKHGHHAHAQFTEAEQNRAAKWLNSEGAHWVEGKGWMVQEQGRQVPLSPDPHKSAAEVLPYAVRRFRSKLTPAQIMGVRGLGRDPKFHVGRNTAPGAATYAAQAASAAAGDGGGDGGGDASEAKVGPIDRKVWARAEAAAMKSYGDLRDSDDPSQRKKFYGTTMTIYKNMIGVREAAESLCGYVGESAKGDQALAYLMGVFGPNGKAAKASGMSEFKRALLAAKRLTEGTEDIDGPIDDVAFEMAEVPVKTVVESLVGGEGDDAAKVAEICAESKTAHAEVLRTAAKLLLLSEGKVPSNLKASLEALVAHIRDTVVRA